MMMFEKTKQAVENWLRAIVSEEVNNINRDLQGERAALRAQIVVCDDAFKAHLQSFDNAVKRLIEVSEHSKENVVLRDTIRQLDSQLTVVSDTFKKLHPNV